jgi:hypothetical protein
MKLVVIIPYETRETTCIPGMRDLIEDLHAFHERWNGRVTDAQARDIVEKFRQQCLGHEHGIETIYLCDLRKLFLARLKWHRAEEFVKIDMNIGGIFKECPEPVLSKLKAAIRGDAEEDVDLVAHFRKAMAAADEAEAAYKRERREFEESWSDRMGDPLFQTIDRGDVLAATPLIEAAAGKLSASLVD